MVLVSVPQPQQRLTFHFRGRPRRVIIPPTYSEDSDEQVAGVLRDVLGPPGLRFRSVSLPKKLLAVRSRLARYGKNNIS